MANELDRAMDSARIIFLEISDPKVVAVYLEEPRGLVLGPGAVAVALLMGRGTLGQIAARTRGEQHRMIIRCYTNYMANVGLVESIIRRLLDAVQTKVEANITLNDSENVLMAIVQGEYDTKYQRIGGVMYRVMDIPLFLSIRKVVTWQQE